MAGGVSTTPAARSSSSPEDDRALHAFVLGLGSALSLAGAAVGETQERLPGALGPIGVTEIVSDPASASLADLITPVGSVVSIALGVLAGVSLFRVTTAR